MKQFYFAVPCDEGWKVAWSEQGHTFYISGPKGPIIHKTKKEADNVARRKNRRGIL